MTITIPCLSEARAYLSGPIENDLADVDWRLEPISVLRREFGLYVFDPHADPKQQWLPKIKEAHEREDYKEVSRIAKNFVNKDLGVVDRCDILIAYLPKGVQTTGTVHEIINSNNAKKPTLLVSEHRKNIPLWFYGFIPPELMFSGWDELYGYLREVNEGKHQDNRRWAFLYGLI